jgi:AmmeMemoRadiSam system protein B
MGEPLSIWDRGSWDMPGGTVRVDEELCASLSRKCPGLISDAQAHLREHCLEVQVPFLQHRRHSLRIAPVVVGTSRLETLRLLGEAVAATIQEARSPVLVVVSSDMTHFESAEVAAAKDRMALERMELLDAEGLHRVVREESISMCGFAPAVAGMVAARELGATSGRLVLYSHSGEVSGDTKELVGYAGMVFT